MVLYDNKTPVEYFRQSSMSGGIALYLLKVSKSRPKGPSVNKYSFHSFFVCVPRLVL